MSSASAIINTATTALSTGIIVAIVIGSVVGLAILICIIVFLYCVCYRKKRTYPGAVIQVPAYSGPANQAPPYAANMDNNQQMNSVLY